MSSSAAYLSASSSAAEQEGSIPSNTPHYSYHVVSWSAVIAGGLIIISVAALMSILGIAIGFSGVSFLAKSGGTATKIGVVAITWMIVTQWVSSAFGGYVTGRLRARWHGIHPHESYFRDTAHGLLAWCVAAVIAMAVVSGLSSIGLFTGFGALRNEDNTTETSNEASVLNPGDYELDRLLRPARPDLPAADEPTRQQIMRIFAHNLDQDQIAPDDRAYLAQLIIARTGVDETEANRRIDNEWTNEKNQIAKSRQELADAGKAAAKIAVYTFVSLLIGMFIASVASAFGGAHRDEGWGYGEVE